MSETKYIYYFRDFNENENGFFIYTPKQISEFIKKEPNVFFKQLGYDTLMNDLAYALYNAMKIDIIGDYERMYQSHSRT